MKTTHHFNRFIALLILIGVTLACQSLAPKAASTAVSADVLPTETSEVSTSTVSPTAQAVTHQPENRNGENYFEVPSSPDVYPSDIIKQITFQGSGGGDDTDCNETCLKYSDDLLSLSHFLPQQQARLVIYEVLDTGKGEFLTEVAIEFDDNGEYILHVDQKTKGLAFFIYDLEGNVLSISRGWLDSSGLDDTCPGLRRTRLTVGMKAIALTTQPEVRSEPNQYSSLPVITTLNEGTQMEIIGGPQCVETFVWWNVNTENGYSGWIAEGDLSWNIAPQP